MASVRTQRWALTLNAYDYETSYKPGKDQTSADLLSRLPLPEFPKETPKPGDTVLTGLTNHFCCSYKDGNLPPMKP